MAAYIRSLLVSVWCTVRHQFLSKSNSNNIKMHGTNVEKKIHWTAQVTVPTNHNI